MNGIIYRHNGNKEFPITEHDITEFARSIGVDIQKVGIERVYVGTSQIPPETFKTSSVMIPILGTSKLELGNINSPTISVYRDTLIIKNNTKFIAKESLVPMSANDIYVMTHFLQRH